MARAGNYLRATFGRRRSGRAVGMCRAMGICLCAWMSLAAISLAGDAASEPLKQPVRQVDFHVRVAEAQAAPAPPSPTELPGITPGISSAEAPSAPKTMLAPSAPAMNMESPPMTTTPGPTSESQGAGFFSQRFGESQMPDPRARELWQYRPISVGLFMGVLEGSTLVDDWVSQQSGILGGIRLGWDLDGYWGLEGRIAFGSCRLSDSLRERTARAAADVGLPANDTRRLEFAHDRYSNRSLYDVTLLWYPWGGGRWRPYILTGIGLAQFEYEDLLSNRYSGALIDMPIGIGLKYLVTDRVALRVEATDDILFNGSTGINTLHDISVTGSLELRFGGAQKNYWPWNPGGQSGWWAW